MSKDFSGGRVTIATVNFEPVLQNKRATLRKMEASVTAAVKQDANLILFPETALTGWAGFPCEEAADFAESVPGPATDAIARTAHEHNVFVCFGLIERKDGKVYNSAVAVGPKGVIGVYRKTHPYEPAEPWATPASEYPLVETPWGPVGMGICVEDYLYPEIPRMYAVRGARILLHLTAIPEFPDVGAKDYCEFMKTTLGARAIENNMFVACANLVGREGDLTFLGHSMIIGPRPGQMNYHIFSGPAGVGEEITAATIDLDSLKDLPSPVMGIFERRQPESYGALVRRQDRAKEFPTK